MPSKRIKGITVEIGANTVKLTDALKSVDDRLKKTQTSLNDVNRLLKLDPKNTELLAQKQELLGSAISDTKARMKELNDALAQLKESPDAEKTIDQQRRLEREIAATNVTLKNYQTQLQTMPQTLQSAGRAIGDLADKTRLLSATAGSALVGLGAMAIKAGQSADDLNTLAKQTGFTTDELQKMQYASDRIDVSMETITGAASRMTRQLASNETKFTDLGVATRNADGSFRNVKEIFYDTVRALSDIQNGTERDTAAMDIFGKGANELAGIIDDGGEALRRFGQEAEDAGLILSQDALDAANEFNDKIDELKAKAEAAFLSSGAALAENLIPALEKLLEVGTEVLSWIANIDSGTLELIVGALALTTAISPILTALSTGIELFTTISSAMSAASAVGIPALVASLGTILPVLAAIAAAVTLVIGLFQTLEQEKRNAEWEKYTTTDTAGMTAISAEQARNWMNQDEVQTITNPAGQKSYYVKNSDYSWDKANSAANGWTDAAVWGNNAASVNMTVNVDHVNDLQDLLDMQRQAQQLNRMGGTN